MTAEATVTAAHENRASDLEAAYRVLPPSIDRFIDHKYYLNAQGQCCDAVRQTLIELFEGDYREAALSWGIGAGKSYLTSIANAYITYRVLCLKDPYEYYGLADGSPIAIVNFSVTATQAKRVVFGEIAARIDNSPAFEEPGFQRDTSIHSELRWPDHGLVIFPGNSQSTSALGYNVLAAVVDEASWLPEITDSIRVAGQTGSHHYDAAEELYNATANRILSRGNERWQRDSLFLMISSPRYVGDFLQRKAVEAESKPYIYHSQLSTWQGVPAARLTGETFYDAECGPVPVEFRDQFQRDPERARRDLGAFPSLAIGGFFSDPQAIRTNVNLDMHSPFYSDGHLSPDWRGEAMPPLYVHVDLGLRRDACGVAGAYAKDGRIVQAFVRRITPQEHGGEIDFESIRAFIVSLRDVHGWEIKRVTYDGWQSVDSQQMLRKQGIRSEQLSVDKDTAAYDTYKELLLTGRLDYYFDEQLFGELERLELIKGKKIDHPPGGSKDVADAAAGAVFGAAQSVGSVQRMPDVYKDAMRGAMGMVTGIDARTGEEVTVPWRTYVIDPDGVIDEDRDPNAPAHAAEAQVVAAYPWMQKMFDRRRAREKQ